MNDSPTELADGLRQLAQLLGKYGHNGQRQVVDELLASFEINSPDYGRLAGIDMWGGSGAVWEVSLTSYKRSTETQKDELLFRQSIIRIAAAMNHLGIGTERSQFIAKTFQIWIDKGF